MGMCETNGCKPGLRGISAIGARQALPRRLLAAVRPRIGTDESSLTGLSARAGGFI